jgi:hypothetical protein
LTRSLSRSSAPNARARPAALTGDQSQSTWPGLVAAVSAVLVLGAAVLVAFGGVAAPASAGPYANPTTSEIRDKLRDAAVLRGVPPKILYGIAYQESRWRQFDADGDPLIGFDGRGTGIMQVTSVPAGADVERLKTDIDYNIAIGADILVVKWGYAPTVIPVIGDGSTRCYENWFYAVWAYNGWVAGNQYPYKIWEHVAAGPDGWWTGVPVTPVPPSSLVNGFGVTIATPQPAHYWSPTPLPKPALSVPRAPKRVRAGVRFYVTGTLSPRHAAGARSVEIRCYRSNGTNWVLRRTVLTANRDLTAADGAESTKYVARLSLGKIGRWKFVARALADADHAAVTSAPAYARVRAGS